MHICKAASSGSATLVPALFLPPLRTPSLGSLCDSLLSCIRLTLLTKCLLLLLFHELFPALENFRLHDLVKMVLALDHILCSICVHDSVATLTPLEYQRLQAFLLLVDVFDACCRPRPLSKGVIGAPQCILRHEHLNALPDDLALQFNAERMHSMSAVDLDTADAARRLQRNERINHVTLLKGLIHVHHLDLSE